MANELGLCGREYTFLFLGARTGLELYSQVELQRLRFNVLHRVRALLFADFMTVNFLRRLLD